MTAKAIRAKYKTLHDNLSKPLYIKKETTGITSEEKAEFDTQHGKLWNDMEAELIAEGYLTPPKPERDLITEIDALKERVRKLEREDVT